MNTFTDKWIDPIGSIKDDPFDTSVKNDDFSETCDDSNMNTVEMKKKMKDLIAELAEHVNPIKIRINVRRKSVFKDYLEISKKQWFNNKQLLKVTLLESLPLMMADLVVIFFLVYMFQLLTRPANKVNRFAYLLLSIYYSLKFLCYICRGSSNYSTTTV